MATRKDTSKARPGRNPAPSRRRTAADPADDPPESGPDTLEDAIEDERLRLMKAHSILSCATLAMEEVESSGEYEDDGRRPYFPVVIETASDMVNESVRRLDSVNLKRFRAERPRAD